MRQSLWMTSMGNLTGAPLNGAPSISLGSIIWDLDQALTAIEGSTPNWHLYWSHVVGTDPYPTSSNMVWGQIYPKEQGGWGACGAPPIGYYRPQQHRWASWWGRLGSRKHIHIHSQSDTHTHTHTYTHTHTHSYTHTLIHLHTYTLIHSELQ